MTTRPLTEIIQTIESGEFYSDYDQSTADLGVLRKFEQFVEFVKAAPVSSGTCCCGDNMKGHAEGMDCGHSATNQWDHSLSLWLDELGMK